MDLELTPEQQLIQKTARDFAQREVAPIAAKLDEEHRFPTELVKRMAQMGLLGVAVQAHGEDRSAAGLYRVAAARGLRD